MEILFLVGRVAFGAFFINSGAHHFRSLGSMSGYAASKHIPAPREAVIGSGVMLLLGGISIALGLYPRIGAVLLIVFLLAAAFLVHNFWADTDQQTAMNNRTNFMKNIALAAASLILFSLPASWPLGVAP